MKYFEPQPHSPVLKGDLEFFGGIVCLNCKTLTLTYDNKSKSLFVLTKGDSDYVRQDGRWSCFRKVVS